MPEDALDRVMAVAQNGVEDVGREFEEPDDDWRPLLIIETKTHDGVLVWFDPRFLGSPEGKDALAYTVIPELIKTHDGIAVAMVTSAWYVSVDKREDFTMPESGSLADHPGREEAVFVNGMTATRHRFAQATIHRTDDGPPTLGPWKVHADDGQTNPPFHMEGRMVEPIRRALARQG
jgi:hypothetical protein